jgi:glc operon protein GlcG
MSFMKSIVQIAGFALCALLATFASAQSYGPALDNATAKKIAAGAVAEAQKNGWKVAIAIVDNHGMLVYYERLDDTQTGSNAIALDKAKTAAMFRRPSRAFEEGVTKGRVAILGLQGATPITGGLPIVVGGKIVGGVGVSGVTSDQDEQIAAAGLAGIK